MFFWGRNMQGPIDRQHVGSNDPLGTNNIEQTSLVGLERKVSRMRTYISTFECDEKRMELWNKLGHFKAIKENKFDELLNPLIRCFLSESEFPRYVDAFENFLQNEFQEHQLFAFADRFSFHILFQQASIQEKYVKQFLQLVTLERIKALTIDVFPPKTFDSDLLNRVKADTSVFSWLSTCAAPIGPSASRTIWKICIEDIDNILASFDMLTAAPITAGEAMAFCNIYLGAIKIFASTPEALPFIWVPFAINILRKLYITYCTKTPSTLPPLLVFSDPNFYQCVVPITNRDHILNEISGAWNERVTPILVGESGCGKTSILIEVARRINKRVFPGLSGKGYKVFGGSAFELANAAGPFNGYGHIVGTFKKISAKKEYTILLLDEIQTFDTAQKALLKTYFDNSPQSIRYAVFATTEQGAEDFFKEDDGSLARRFKRINVPNLKIQETRLALNREVRSLVPNLTINPNVIARIVIHANGKLNQSKKILYQVLRKVQQHNTRRYSQEAYNDKSNELDLANEEYVGQLTLDHSEITSNARRISQLQKEKNELEEKLQSEGLIITNYAILLVKRTQLMYKIFGISQEMSRKFQKYLISKGEKPDQVSKTKEEKLFSEFKDKIDKYTKEFIYYNFFLKNALNKKIREFEEEHGFISQITDDFVKEEDLVLDGHNSD